MSQMEMLEKLEVRSNAKTWLGWMEKGQAALRDTFVDPTWCNTQACNTLTRHMCSAELSTWFPWAAHWHVALGSSSSS